MEDAQKKAKEIVYTLWRAPQYNDEIISIFTAKQLAVILVDKILDNIDATIFYHKESVALPFNKEYWMKVKASIDGVQF
jgi:hypothetical protein